MDIEESYISAASACSENERAVYAPGLPILNKPGHERRITAGNIGPCVLAWIGPSDQLSARAMKSSRAGRSTCPGPERAGSARPAEQREEVRPRALPAADRPGRTPGEPGRKRVSPVALRRLERSQMGLHARF
jgi:hypothetical protein